MPTVYRPREPGAFSGPSLPLISCLFLALCLASPSWAGPASTSIKVAMDDNYPPYVMRGPGGQIQGLLVDEWRLWSQVMGVPVEIEATDWGQAQDLMRRGGADVLDTVFETPERKDIYDFTPAYAKVEALIFHHESLGGITDVSSLRGFTVGVKAGDADIGVLKSQGIDSLREYPSYEAVTLAAARGEIRVFCVDKPPGLYYIYKYGLEKDFRSAFTLYTGEFHRAVKKGRADLLRQVEAGFAQIPPEQMKALEDKWLGATLPGSSSRRTFLTVLAGVCGLVLALGVFNAALRGTVRAKTRELEALLAEQRLSQERFQAIFNSVNDAIVIYAAPDGQIVDVNERTCALTGYSRQELLTMRAGDLSTGQAPYDRENLLKIQAKTAGGQPQVLDWLVRAKDGHDLWVEVSYRRAMLGGVERVLASARDISWRKEAEAEKDRALAEKTLLLREIHHRVKNNLQIVSSLLYLQQESLEDPGTLDLFTETRNRIASMALVHEELYRSQDLSRVNLKQYLEDLVPRLVDSLRGTQELRCELRLAEAELPIDKAIPCGLIVNELITNAVKHGFPDGREGRIAVSVDNDGRKLTIQVADDGVGLPGDFDTAGAGTLGMVLLNSLVEQLKGELTVAGHPGASFTFSFEV
jgi:PAS domain S-box-containing protein